MAATATARRTAGRAAPAHRPAPAPRRPVRPAPAPRRPATTRSPGRATVVITAVSAIADSRPVLGLTRSRLWIGLLGTLLVGIVALNVVALSFNATASKTAALSDELREKNSALRAGIADQLSNERLQSAAERIGLVMPQAASALMLAPTEADAERAAARLRRGEFTIGSSYAPPAPEVPEVPPAAPPEDPTVAAVPVAPAAPVVPEVPVAAPVAPAAGTVPAAAQTTGVTP